MRPVPFSSAPVKNANAEQQMQEGIETQSDWDLLQEYVRENSDPAFTSLVNRHVRLVYSVALRHCADPLLAQEVASTVFQTLALKAGAVKPGVNLTGWLFKAVRYVASNARSFQNRRRRWDSEAARFHGQLQDESLTGNAIETAKAWEIVTEQLDLAVAELNEPDRTAILLRFYESKSLRETGEELGISEEAARKRTARALEKLRKLLTGRGVVCPAATVVLALSTCSALDIPPELLKKLTPARTNGTPSISIPESVWHEPGRSVPPVLLRIILLTGFLCGLFYTARALYFWRVAGGGGPKKVFLYQNEIVQRGDGEEYVKTIYLYGPEEKSTAPFLVNSVRSRQKLKTSVVNRFGEEAFLRSGFPGFLDFLDPSRLAASTELIQGTNATLQLPWGPRLPFVRESGSWKLATFRIPNIPPPAHYQKMLAAQNAIIANAMVEIEAGRWTEVNECFEAIRQRWQLIPR
jgi:RNA polymerase sigma factor (sigma-70 family)